jgi:Zn-dependent peptidase ImmA (M78 family)
MNQKDLIGKILQASNVIAKSANRGSANHLVISSFIAEKWSDIFKNEKRKEKIEELWGISSKDTTGHT